MTVRTMNASAAIADALLLTINEGVTIFDDSFRLVAWNESFCDLEIVPRDKVQLGLHIDEVYEMAAARGLFGSEHAEETARARSEQVRVGTSPSVEDLIGIDGATIEVRRYFLPNIGVAAIFSDVTHERYCQSRIRRTQELESLARLTGGFAHDFNNILQVILVNLELAQNSINADSHLELAIDATLSGAKLSKSMLSLARPDMELSDRRQIFEVGDSVVSIVSWCQHALRDNVEIVTRIGKAVCIRGDHSRFCSSLLNLILNSQDALPDGGKIVVSVERDSIDENRVRVSVQDWGLGMSPQLVAMVNEPFFTTKGGNRVGLGLHEVNMFARSIGGQLEIESRLGLGTTVSLALPTVTPPLGRLAKDEVAEQVDGEVPYDRQVLLVEDNVEAQVSLQRFLNQLGCRTTSVCRGEDALALLRALPVNYFDALISDIMLAGAIDGLQLADEANGLIPKGGIILCTAQPQTITQRNHVQILHKPIGLAKLRVELTRTFADDLPVADS